MTNRTKAALIALLLLATVQAIAATLPADHLRFDYVDDQAPAVGLVRVFDDGKRTFLQFDSLETRAPTLTGDHGQAIAFRAVGNYAVLDSVLPLITVRAAGQEAHPRLASYTPPPPKPAAAPVAHEQNGFQPAPTAAAAKAAPAHTTKPTSSIAAKPAAKPVPKPVPKPVLSPWTLHTGEMLSQVITRWSEYAGWNDPQWRSQWDYRISAEARLDGSFAQAITTLLDAYNGQCSATSPDGTPLPDGNPLCPPSGKPAAHPLHALLYTPQRIVVVVDAAPSTGAN